VKLQATGQVDSQVNFYNLFIPDFLDPSWRWYNYSKPISFGGRSCKHWHKANSNYIHREMIAKTPFLMTQVNEIGNRLDKSRPGGGVGSRKKKRNPTSMWSFAWSI